MVYPQPEILKGGSCIALTQMICLTNGKSSQPNFLEKRMIAPKLLKDEAAPSRSRVVSLLRKKLRLPFARAANFPPRSSSHPHLSKDEDRTERVVPPSGKSVPYAESRAVRHGMKPTSLTPLETKVAAAKKAKESPTQTGVRIAGELS
ncbi:hypothetical protein L3X38_004262 [Prunus dulcis]|uniref:Uncharacterized protein n=1 Tax=Prunus dulcis TaxID=3755 RepID=A0AAD4ZNQ1_PRUDU|nr:hypothetical protein L3X38_004262 [Prunus dulcis]